MSRPLALLVCLPVIIWLWRRDVRVRPKFSSALWLAIIWVFVLGSRPISWWLGVGGGSGGGDLEGNWFDRLSYTGLILVSIHILSRRGTPWSSLIGHNKTLFLFYLFLLLTAVWAPFPFVVCKRWFKDIGAISLILLILTEAHPLQAFKAVFARCAYVWFPLSELFAKYFPQIGRDYSRAGFATYTGVTTQKNSLGEITMVVCLILLSELFKRDPDLRPGSHRYHRLTILLTLAMGLWLLLLCNSKTSLICLIIGATVVGSHRIPLLGARPGRFLCTVFAAMFLLAVAEVTFDVSDKLLGLVGRDATLTERTVIWAGIKETPVDPVFGCGYMMYWELYKGVRFETRFYNVKSAHNSYLETYLDGGVIALGLILAVLIVMGVRIIREFLTGSEYGRLALAFYAVVVVYGMSESVLARRSPLWFILLLFGLNAGFAWRQKPREEVLRHIPNEKSLALGTS
jgi:exopolysaccharide production protein ExoQ